MITTRRGFFRHLGISAIAAVPLVEVLKSHAASVPQSQDVIEPIVPPPHPKPAVVEPHHAPVVHKPHVRKEPYSHTGAHNLRAVHTLNTPGPRQTFALTIWGEARGYGELGMRSVGHVILNRVKAGQKALGDSVIGVCRKRKQFSCWNSGDPNRARMKELAHLDSENPDWQAWVTADKLAAKMLAGLDQDNTCGSTYYCASYMQPYWHDDMIVTGVMFGHTFYKPKPKVHHHRHHHHHKKHHRKHH